MTEKSIFQTPDWEKFRLKTGYQKSYWVDDILVLQKNLPLGRSMLYSPRVNSYQLSAISYQSLTDKVRVIGKENQSLFYRLELDIPLSNTDNRLPIIENFRKAFEEMQPEHTLKTDISKSEEDILAGMKQKGRYNIKIAQKNNLKIASSTTKGQELESFYKLYSAMASRHGITHRSKQYFEGLLDILGQKDYARIYIATTEIEGKVVPLAGVLAIFYGETAIYLYGGSANNFRNMMAPYILHWKIIHDAKAKGCKEYDWFGVAPEGLPHHPWAGVTRFKEQFGGKREEILGSYDLPLRPLEYQLFKIAERIRRH